MFRRALSLPIILSLLFILPAGVFGAGGSASAQDYYKLVSNESVSSLLTEPTGTFKIANLAPLHQKFKSSVYRIDYQKPFDLLKYLSLRKYSIRMEMKKTRPPRVGDTKKFWVSNLASNKDYQISAKLLYSGSHADVWVYNNQLNGDQAAQLGKEFDNRIYARDTRYFGMPSDVDGNGKVNILCYDIQDGFDGSGGYVAGYFYPLDLFDADTSNKSEIFYIDTYPLMGTGTSKNVNVTEAYSTLAHEFQHMISFNQKVFIQHHWDTFDTWIDEGMSMAAEQIYTGKPLSDRIDDYNNDASITNGHSLLYWDDSGDVLANYSLSYLFMEYLKIQCGQGDAIFKKIMDDPNTNEKAIQDVIQKYIDPNLTFGQFMTDFRAALVLKQTNGLYGFKGNAAFKPLRIKTYNGSSLKLKGGGAVVKKLSSASRFSVPSGKGRDVTYTLLSGSIGGKAQQPKTPKVWTVGDNSTSISGSADPGIEVAIMKNGKILARGTADGKGYFKVPVSKQKAGTVLYVYTEAGLKSSKVKVTVKDKTAPGMPTAGNVTTKSTHVAGKAEKSAVVYVYRGSKQIGKATANAKGAYSVRISKQKKGTKLSIFAKDRAGNKSKTRMVTVR